MNEPGYATSETSSGAYAPMEGALEFVDYRASATKSMDQDNLMAASEESMDLSVEVQDSKIIKTGQLTLHVENVKEMMDELPELLKAWDGQVLNSNIFRGENSYTSNATVRVASDQFELAMLGLKEAALYTDYESVNSDDVTEVYMDTQSRLANAQALEKQYLEILNRAGSMTEVLDVTRSLADVRAQIESMQNQIKYYDTRVAYSTIDLSYSEDALVSTVREGWAPVSTVHSALSDWVVFLQKGTDAVIYLLVFAWPLLILGAVVWLWKRRR